MRIYIASILQETNTFCPVHTDISYFQRGYLLEGEEIEKKLLGTNTEVGGFLQFLKKQHDVEIIQGVAAWAVASGKITTEAFHSLVSRILKQIESLKSVDGILLCLHGALVCESMEDCEGYILEKVRNITSDYVKIVSTLDYHAVITERMVIHADVLIGYRTYPHNDFMQTGEKAANCIVELIKHPKEMKKIFKKLPLILPVENTETEVGPMSHVIKELEKLDRSPGLFSVSAFCPQPWLDIHDTGVSIIAYADSENESVYDRYVQELISYIWDVKEQFFLKFPDMQMFLSNIETFERPIIVVDSGDITSAGGLGDSTHILREIIKENVILRSVFMIVDKDSVNLANEIGEGNSGWFSIGGKHNYGYNEKVSIFAHVIKISDNLVEVKGSSFSGVKLNMGKRVLLRCNNSINIILSEYTSLIHDPEVLRSMGVSPEEQDIIVQKSHKLFRPAYRSIANSVVILNTPGFTSPDLRNIGFQNLNRPIYPLDEFA